VKAGDVILARLVQADGASKARPALVLHRWLPFGDLLVCGISGRLHRFIPGLDEFLRISDSDYKASGLKNDSIIRLGFLGTIPISDVHRQIGGVSNERISRLRFRLSSLLGLTQASLERILGIIPARHASTRFPGKPLALISGKPLIQHVVERCQKAKSLADVIVATDDSRIAEVAQKFCRVEMTAANHPSGSDRIAEVVARCQCDAVINIQGDEPLIDPGVIDAVAGALAGEEMSTAAAPIRNPEELENPNVVKVVVNAAGRALYFSRRTIPYLREAAASGSASEQLAAFPFLKHLGIYGYRRETLLRLVKWPVSSLEQAERLEQLRALENGVQIAVVKVDYDGVGVDVPEDVARVERMLADK
jgi:3-deoxy-manno-octulosonate cytidylyltransferase (CMP-KDO synthetase)